MEITIRRERMEEIVAAIVLEKPVTISKDDLNDNIMVAAICLLRVHMKTLRTREHRHDEHMEAFAQEFIDEIMQAAQWIVENHAELWKKDGPEKRRLRIHRDEFHALNSEDLPRQEGQ